MSPTDEEYAAFKRSEYERIKPAFLSEPPSNVALAEALLRQWLQHDAEEHPRSPCGCRARTERFLAALASSGSTGETD
jgi:hypothetical protein